MGRAANSGQGNVTIDATLSTACVVKNLTVLFPDHLQLMGTPLLEDAGTGYITTYTYAIVDNTNHIMAVPAGYNEHFGADLVRNKAYGDCKKYTNGYANWDPQNRNNPPGKPGVQGMLQDSIAMWVGMQSVTPCPEPKRPGQGNKNEVVVKIQQSWFVGSTISGHGCLVQNDIFTYYINHGEHGSPTVWWQPPPWPTTQSKPSEDEVHSVSSSKERTQESQDKYAYACLIL